MSSDQITGLGARTDFIAQVPHVDVKKLNFTPDEDLLFVLVGRATRIEEVITRSSLSESLAIATLLSLRAKGAIVPARVKEAPPPNLPRTDAALLEEIDIDVDRKAEILAIEARLETANYFELLGVKNLAPADEARRSFYELSRKFHPDRFFGKNLGSFRARVEKIFRKLTEANETLADVDKRAAYLRANPGIARPNLAGGGPQATAAATQNQAAPASSSEPAPRAAQPATPEDKARSIEDSLRDSERRARLTRHPYLARTAKVSDLIKHAQAALAKNEPSMAINDLTMATQIDPRNEEAKALLADARKRNDVLRAELEAKRGRELVTGQDHKGALEAFRAAAMLNPSHAEANHEAARLMVATNQDLREASALAQKAVELEPKKAPYRQLYASILTQAGMDVLAKKQFEELLKLEPSNPEAKKALKRRWPF